MAHAVLAAAELIARQPYPDTPMAELSEKQKETVSALSSLAAGLAGGGLAGAFSGAQAGINAVENNYL